MRCETCGNENTEGSKFCFRCGSRMPEGAEPAPSSAPPPPPAAAAPPPPPAAAPPPPPPPPAPAAPPPAAPPADAGDDGLDVLLSTPAEKLPGEDDAPLRPGDREAFDAKKTTVF